MINSQVSNLLITTNEPTTRPFKRLRLRDILLIAALTFALNSILLTERSWAQVNNCDGVWSNLPCDAAKAPQNPVKIVPKDESKPVQSKELSQKKSLLHELNMKKIEAERYYKLRYDITNIENYCLIPEVSVEKCQEKVEQLADKIDQRVASLEVIRAQNRANQLQEERNRLDAEKADNSVVIINQPGYYDPTPTPFYQFPNPRGPNYRQPSVHQHGNVNININNIPPPAVLKSPIPPVPRPQNHRINRR